MIIKNKLLFKYKFFSQKQINMSYLFKKFIVNIIIIFIYEFDMKF